MAQTNLLQDECKMFCMTTIADKVQTFRLQRGLNTAQLAKLVGTSRQNIENLEAGQVDQPRYLARLAATMQISVEDLLDTRKTLPTYDGKRGPAEDVAGLHNAVPNKKTVRVVPLINRVPAGNWQYVVDAIQPGDAEDLLHTTADVSESGFALRVVGDSMTNPSGAPSFPAGTILYVNPMREPVVGNFVVVRHNSDSEFTFKRLAKDAGKLYLEPLNTRYPLIPMPSDAYICGVVVSAEIQTV